jgi:ACDE family multidrug resistance protein
MTPLGKLLPIYLGAVITPIGGVGILTLLPVIAQGWKIPIQWVSLAMTIYMIPFVVFQLISGPIAHIFDTRKTLLFGFGVYGLGGFLSGLSPDLIFLLAARFLQGFGAAFINPIVMALIGEMVDSRSLGKSMGIMQLMYTCGVTMGPLVSGILEIHFGWPSFFFLLGFLGVGNGIFYGITSRGPAGERKEGGSPRFRDTLAAVQKSYSFPDVRFLSVGAFFLFLSYIGLMTFMADSLKERYGLPSDQVGLLLSMTGFFGMIAAPFAGLLGERMGWKRVGKVGGSIMAMAILGMGLVEYSYRNYLFLFALFGTGSAIAWTCLNTMAVQLIPDFRKPVASLYGSFKFSGYALAPVVLSVFYLSFSIEGVRWACLGGVLISLFWVSKIGNSSICPL